MKNFWLNFFFTFTAVFMSILFILPSLYTNLWPYKKINLGLDLRGGMHVLLSVNTDEVIKNCLDKKNKELRYLIREKHASISNYRIDDEKNMFLMYERDKNYGLIETLETLIQKKIPCLKISDFNNLNDIYSQVKISFTTEEINKLRELTVSQTLENIRNRIDQFGVNEPEIRKHGLSNILVQLPGITNIERTKELIEKTAYLEFRLVKSIALENNEENIGLSNNNVVMYKNSGKNFTVILSDEAFITGSNLLDARVGLNSINNKPEVIIKLNRHGGKVFSDITKANVNERLAIVLDDNICCMPVINEEISGGEAVISGNFSIEEAKNLAISLSAGSLPAPVKIIEERTIGPSMGESSIQSGILSILVGYTLVAIFMILYYKLAGFVTNLALILNVLMVGAGLAIFQATLTLPGIAGIILTIGMAVDSNVIIFERIKDELKLGTPLLHSIALGYKRATVTIIDANFTTIIAAIVLFKFGAGMIKGFSVTLALGIFASLFISLVVTRVIIEYISIKFEDFGINKFLF